MKKVIVFTALIILALAPLEVFAYNDAYYKSMAKFIYGFPKMVGEQGGLCVYGYDQVAVAIKEKYKDPTFFQNEPDLKDLTKNRCKVLYISKNKDLTVYPIIKIANDARIVSIGVDDNFVDKGGMVLVQMGRRNFELTVHHKNIKEFAIKLDPLAAGLVVN